MADIPAPERPGQSVPVVRFLLTVDGIELAQFSEVAISSEVEPVELLDQSGDKLFRKKLPGTRLLATLTFKRGLNEDIGLFAWHQSVVEGQLAAARKDCVVTMVDASGAPVARFHLESAWPSKIEVGALKAGATEVLMETVTLTCDSLRRVKP